MPKTKVSVRVAVGFVVSNDMSGHLSCDEWDEVCRVGSLLSDVECCGKDLRVGSAAAEIAADGVLDVVETGIWIALQQGCAAHDHTGGAKTALHGVMLHEGSLHLMHGVAVGEALDGCDLAAYCVDGERHTGEGRGVVDPDRASGAGAAIADDFC